MRFPFFSRLFNSGQVPRHRYMPRRNALRFEQLEDRRMLATIPVSLATDAANPTDLDNGITLREAITYVNTGDVPNGDQALIDFTEALGTNDKIIFDSTLSGDTITLTEGQLYLLSSVNIDAEGQDITIDGNDASRIFNIVNTDVTLEDHAD